MSSGNLSAHLSCHHCIDTPGRQHTAGPRPQLPGNLQRFGLAFFFEPGETLEECVHREVLEETGLHIKNLKYFGASRGDSSGIMIGFTIR